MKYLTLTVAAAIGLAATQSASAQGVLYNAIPASGGVSFFTGTGNTYSGDVIRIAPGGTYDTLRVLYVATAPGTYNLDINDYNTYTFPTSIPVPTPPAPIPITIPAGGTFPSVWRLTFTATGPITIGPQDQAFTFQSDSAAFSTAYANFAAAPAGSDVPTNMFMIDTNANNILEPGPPVNEAYNFGAGAWNLAFSLTTAPLFATCQLENSGVIVERVDDMVALPVNRVLSARINPDL